MADRVRPAVATLLSLLLLAGCGGEPEARFNGSVLENPFTVPDIDLTDTGGKPFSLAADTDKRLTLLFFGYTNCPDICLTVMQSLASAMTRLDEQDREQVDVVFVTTDPARDTAPVLRRWLDGYDPSFIGLTGELETIIEVGDPLAVYVSSGEKLPSGGYDLGGHTTQITAIDGGDQAPVYWSEATSSAEYASDIHTLLAQED
ncbi:MAG: SCO family protein [Nocardioides sp.]